MLDFFVALFGAIGIGAKYSHEKSVSKKADEQNKKWIDDLYSDLGKWERKVVDEKKEYGVSKITTTDELYIKMHDRIKNEAKIEYVTDDMIRMGLLAQYGKIPKQTAMHGVRSHGIWDYEEKQRWSIQRKYFLWYDRELGKNGIEEPLLFVSGVDENKIRHNIRLAAPISTGTQMVGGRYFWEPMRANVF